MADAQRPRWPQERSGGTAEVPDLDRLPKVELHVHLEGSIRATTAIALARRHGEDPHEVLPFAGAAYPRRFDDFDHFVRTYLAVTRQVRTPDDLAAVAEAFARQQAAQSVRYSEVTFTATTVVGNGMRSDEMWAALREGFGRVPDTRVALIVDAVRDGGAANGHLTVELVAAAEAPIAGLGLAGSERAASEGEFTMLREAADAMGLGLTVHAGETGGPENIRRALDLLGADRIGHGVAAVRDPALLERLASEGTVLEVCPSSNVVLGVAGSLDEHPLPTLVGAGVAVTVNSDDPPFFSTTLTDELRHVRDHLGLDRDGVAALQRRAATAAFVDDATRARLVADVDAWAAGVR